MKPRMLQKLKQIMMYFTLGAYFLLFIQYVVIEFGACDFIFIPLPHFMHYFRAYDVNVAKCYGLTALAILLIGLVCAGILDCCQRYTTKFS